MSDMVLILNYDDISSRAVARALRAEHICCKIVPPGITRQEVAAREPRGLILAGGVSGGLPAGMDAGLASGDWPVLAMGDAAAMLCRALGGDALETAICGSIGTVSFFRCPLTEGLDDCERLLHNVRRLRLPDFARPLAESQGETVGFLHGSLPIYGIQFTLEQNDTDGMQLLLGFALQVCGCTRWWGCEAFVAQAVEEIGRAVGDGRALCAMTGGLNSGVCAMLAHRALGERLQCVFIDTGLMRENEASRFLGFYRDQAGLPIVHVQAQERFLEALGGVAEPEEKRRIIGELLRRVLEETAAQLGGFSAVVRSVICTEVMQGAPRPAVLADLPSLEPLGELFKEEVRRVGEYLGLPAEIIARPSFPGSGLALRILGEVTPARLQTLRAAEQIFQHELAETGQEKRLWQYFAVLGAMQGSDTHVMIALRAVQSSDAAQQAYAARLPYDLLERVAAQILRERPEVKRVVYDLSPATRTDKAEWQ